MTRKKDSLIDQLQRKRIRRTIYYFICAYCRKFGYPNSPYQKLGMTIHHIIPITEESNGNCEDNEVFVHKIPCHDEIIHKTKDSWRKYVKGLVKFKEDMEELKRK